MRLPARSGTCAVLFSKQHVVVLVRFERGIEVAEINGLVFDVTPKNVEVIAVVKKIHRLESIEGQFIQSSLSSNAVLSFEAIAAQRGLDQSARERRGRRLWKERSLVTRVIPVETACEATSMSIAASGLPCFQQEEERVA